MKQSKKLLSIFLAMLMLLGTVSVVGNAAYQRNKMAYDSIDNPAPTADQVANVVLDVVDELLYELDFNEDYTVVKLNFTSVDNALKSIYGLNGVKGIAGGDLAKLNLDACKDKTRANTGDLGIIYVLLQFIYDNADVLSKAAYGIGTKNGLDLGWLIDLIGLDLGDIGTLLEDIPGFLTKTVFDMLIYGSYGYPSDSEALGGKLPAEADSLDEIVNTAVTGLLTKPQQYSYNEAGEKVWDMNSYILTESKIAGLDLTLTNNSIFSIIDKIIQIAYADFGTVALNHDVKKLFMEGMGVDFVEVTDASELTKIKADPDYIDVENNDSRIAQVKNYFCNAQMWEVDGVWYFRDYVTRDVLDANGDPVLNADGSVKTAKTHRFQRAEAYTADSLYGLFNWNYKLTDTTLNFNDMIGTYGSIIGSLNHLLYVIFKQAINPTALGISSIDEIWDDGDNSYFNENLMTTAKFLLKKFTFKFFGRNEAYVDLKTLEAKPEFVAKLDTFGNDAAGREGLIAYMLLPFLGDALPQLVYDVNMFDAGLQIEQVAVLLVREFLSDLTPQINYDDQIFVNASLVDGREFQDKSSPQWIELLLNMGLDLAAVYLDNISNFNVSLENLQVIKGYAVAAGAPAYMGVLEEIIDWAVDYVGEGATSVLVGADPTSLGSVRCLVSYDHTTDTAQFANNYAGNAFTMLSTVLNNLLPLGLLCNVSSAEYALDVKMVFDRLIDVIDDLDLEVLLGTFGRNGRDDNLLGATNVIHQVLSLVNKLIKCVLGFDLFPVTTSLNGAVTQANLKTIVANLLKSLNNRREGLIPNALPLVAVFITDFGGEQTFRTPGVDIDGAVTGTGEREFYVKNSSRGIWRSYMKNGTRVQDEHYNLILENVTACNYDGSTSSYVSISSTGAGNYAYGKKATVKYKVNNIPATGALVRFDITYKMTGSDGSTPLTNESTTISRFMWLNANGGLSHDPDKEYDTGKKGIYNHRTRVYGGVHIYDTSAYTEAQIDEIVAGFNGKLAYRITKDKNIVGSGTIGIDLSGAKTQCGVTYPDVYKEKPKESLDRSYNFTVSDPVAFKNAIVNGGAMGWRISGYANDSSAEFSNEPAIWIFHNQADLDALRELVDQEVNTMRLPSGYDTTTQAWANYTAAFQPAFRAARQEINENGIYNYKELYNNLEAAVEEVEKVEKLGSTNIGSYINTLKATVKDVNSKLNGNSYRTYALYRWNILNGLRNDANNAIALYERTQYTAAETMFFPYNGGISENQIKSIAANYQFANANYGRYITALLKNMSEEDAAEAKRRFREDKAAVANLQPSELGDINDQLSKSFDRLLPRDGGVVKTYLEKEINSAVAIFGEQNNGGYTTRSWNAYITALNNAKTARDNSSSQDAIFDAKYRLQVARNNLRTTAAEADYTELETLIAQAQYVFNNVDLYDNTDLEFGTLLAAYGHDAVVVNDTTYNLFPDSALNINATSVDKGDQEDIDAAADALKKALSRMEFKGANYAGATVTDSQVTTGEQGADGEKVTETVRTTKLSAKELLADVTAKFGGTTATGASNADVKISLDDSYTLTDDNANKFVGTGATITIYTTANGVTIPLSTIKVVVDGDLTGDGVIDVLDCTIVEFSVTGATSVNGVFEMAGNVDGSADGITIADLSGVANIAQQQMK